MPSVTLGSLVSRVYQYLENNTLFYTRDDVVSAVNEAVRTLNLFTGFLQSSAPMMLTVKNRVFYDVPSTILLLQRVKFRGRYLEPVGLTAYSNTEPNWMLARTTTRNIPVTYWIPIGMTRFALSPADGIGGGQMILTGVTEPTPLVTDDQVMQFPNEYDTTVIELAKHTVQLDEGGVIFAQAATGYQDFLSDEKKLSLFRALKMPSYYVDQKLRK